MLRARLECSTYEGRLDTRLPASVLINCWFAVMGPQRPRGLQEMYGVNPTYVKTSPNRMSKFFRPATSSEMADFKAVRGITKPYLLIVGARWPYKNYDILTAALASLPEHMHRSHLLVAVGPGERDGMTKLSYTSMEIKYLERISEDDLRAAYSAAEALIYPSRSVCSCVQI